MSGWQPIATAPRDGTHVLAYTVVDMYEVVHWTDADGWMTWFEESTSDPTHWMPLPPPPRAYDGDMHPIPPKAQPVGLELKAKEDQ